MLTSCYHCRFLSSGAGYANSSITKTNMQLVMRITQTLASLFSSIPTGNHILNNTTRSSSRSCRPVGMLAGNRGKVIYHLHNNRDSLARHSAKDSLSQTGTNNIPIKQSPHLLTPLGLPTYHHRGNLFFFSTFSKSSYIHPLSQIVLEHLQSRHIVWLRQRGLDKGLELNNDGTFSLRFPSANSDGTAATDSSSSTGFSGGTIW